MTWHHSVLKWRRFPNSCEFNIPPLFSNVLLDAGSPHVLPLRCPLLLTTPATPLKVFCINHGRFILTNGHIHPHSSSTLSRITFWERGIWSGSIWISITPLWQVNCLLLIGNDHNSRAGVLCSGFGEHSFSYGAHSVGSERDIHQISRQ